ncbi:MAG: DUF1801 domain-containing protein [Xanthomonadales bacterium]|nr:DUF1801 domain-containing protein [Xanthomonadales bacterium]
MSEAKTRPHDASVSKFLDQVEDPQKREDCATLVEMLEAVTGREARMWGTSIVGFGQYHYVYASGREGDWPLIGFSPRAQNLSIYIMAGFGEYEDLLGRLGKHKTGKSCLYVKRLSDIDPDVLREMATRSVAWMREKYDCS